MIIIDRIKSILPFELVSTKIVTWCEKIISLFSSHLPKSLTAAFSAGEPRSVDREKNTWHDYLVSGHSSQYWSANSFFNSSVSFTLFQDYCGQKSCKNLRLLNFQISKNSNTFGDGCKCYLAFPHWMYSLMIEKSRDYRTV